MSSVVQIYEQTINHLLSPIADYLADESISEVMINGHDEIYIERRGKVERTPAKFTSEIELEAAMRNVAQFVGKRLEPQFPSIEARLPDGWFPRAYRPGTSRA